jgi:hypothetical protein
MLAQESASGWHLAHDFSLLKASQPVCPLESGLQAYATETDTSYAT